MRSCHVEQAIDVDKATFGSDDFDDAFYATAANLSSSKPGNLLNLAVQLPNALQQLNVGSAGASRIRRRRHRLRRSGQQLHPAQVWQLPGARQRRLLLGGVAARKAWFGHKLSKQWVGFGHSQGGGAIWKVAESSLVRNDSSYLGTVAMAPATSIVDMAVDNFSAYTTPGLATILPLSLSRANPSYNSTFVSATVQKRLRLEERAQSFIYSIVGVPADLAQKDMVSRDAITQQLPQFLQWQNETAPARGGRSSAPILVIQGADDPTVLAPYTVEALARSCDAGSMVALTVYPGASHTSIVQVSEPEWTSWLDGRFLGRKLPGSRSSRSCSFVTAKAINAKSMTVDYLSNGVNLDG